LFHGCLGHASRNHLLNVWSNFLGREQLDAVWQSKRLTHRNEVFSNEKFSTAIAVVLRLVKSDLLFPKAVDLIGSFAGWLFLYQINTYV
jgi:hypothetical protein